MADCLRLNDNGTADYKEAEKQWIAFSNRKTLYDQIRFIDVEGNEGVYNRRTGFEKLSQLYKNIGRENCNISVSHGVEVFRCDSNQFNDEIVNNADEKMYNEKREIKKSLKVLRI